MRFPFTRARACVPCQAGPGRSGPREQRISSTSRECTRERESGYARGIAGRRGLAWVSIKIITADGGAFLSGIENRFTVAATGPAHSCTCVSFSAARHRPAHVPPEPVVIDSRVFGCSRKPPGSSRRYVVRSARSTRV